MSDTNRQIKRINLLEKLSFKIASLIQEKEKIFDFFYNNKQKQLINSKYWNYLDNEMYKNFLHKLFVSNNSHLSYLLLNDKIIAAHLGYVVNKNFYYLFPTYDEEYSKYSPGNILLLKLIENFFNDNGQVFDFTTGDEIYKLRLSNIKRKMFYKNFSLTFKGQLLNFTFILIQTLKSISFLKKIYRKMKY